VNGSTASTRLVSLDVFRGLTIMAMLVVNSPGHHGQLSHSKWVGITFADVIFPFFLFIVGVTIHLSTQRGAIGVHRIAQRSAALFALGLLVNLVIAHFQFLRVAGVLQRIAIAYAVCALLAPTLGWRGRLHLAGALLLAYWLAMLLVPVPGVGAGVLEPGINLAAWIDQRALPGTLRRGTWDPEGLLSTLPAIATTLLGMLAGQVLTGAGALEARLLRMMVAGAGCLLAGYVWSFWFPPIKPLWTSSFVLLTAGLAMLSLASLAWYTDVLGARRATFAAAVFGANATFAYVFHEMLATLFTLDVGAPGQPVSVWGIASGALQAWGLDTALAALVYSAAFVALCFIPIWTLYRRGIFLKV
jgi:predicted acyltransferase